MTFIKKILPFNPKKKYTYLSTTAPLPHIATKPNPRRTLSRGDTLGRGVWKTNDSIPKRFGERFPAAKLSRDSMTGIFRSSTISGDP